MNVLSLLLCSFLVLVITNILSAPNDPLDIVDIPHSSFAPESSPWYNHTRHVLQQLHQSVNVTAARQCLANRHIVWIGDSNTRFQFMTLLHLLEFGRWCNSSVSFDHTRHYNLEISLCRERFMQKRVPANSYFQQIVSLMSPCGVTAVDIIGRKKEWYPQALEDIASGHTHTLEDTQLRLGFFYAQRRCIIVTWNGTYHRRSSSFMPCEGTGGGMARRWEMSPAPLESAAIQGFGKET
jgi:hypothetical protein